MNGNVKTVVKMMIWFTVENDHIHDINELNRNINVVEADFTKYENMAFDPLRFESTTKETDLDDNANQININCKYITNDQLNQMLSNKMVLLLC